MLKKLRKKYKSKRDKYNPLIKQYKDHLANPLMQKDKENTFRHLHLADGSPIYDVSVEIEIGSINCSAWSWGLQKTIGNISLKEKYQDAVSAVIVILHDSHPIILRRGPFLNPPQRNAIPAPLNL